MLLPNQLFALVLTKGFGVPAKFKKQGDVYKTYSIPEKFVYDPAKHIVTHLRTITTFNGYEYGNGFESEIFKVEDNNGEVTIARIVPGIQNDTVHEDVKPTPSVSVKTTLREQLSLFDLGVA